MVSPMRGLTHRWIEPKPAAFSDTDGPAGTLEPLVARVLAARGLGDADDARRFCNPVLTAMHDPGLLPGAERAAERLLEALKQGEKIVVFGDYDVDGICGAALLFNTLAAIDPMAPMEGRLATYVPHRVDEGYGLSVGALRELAATGARVVVSVDCGITAVEEARAAREMGVDLIVTDHHTPRVDGSLPDALAVVHPRIAGSAEGYPFGGLAGAGVAFKLAWRVATMAAGGPRVDEAMRRVLMEGLALAGLATVADMVPLEGENRLIARFGLAELRRVENAGVRALLEVCQLGAEPIGSREAGFVLGPRLNACGRMGHAQEAIELLTLADTERGAAIAARLDKQNRARRDEEKRIFEEAAERAEAAGMTGGRGRAIVLSDRSWHVGVVGIVCSRLVGRYCRPSVLLCDDGELAKGSGRSIEGFSLHGALASCAHVLEKFGGHEMAAGLAVRSAGLETFREAFHAVAHERIKGDMLTPRLRIDCAATLDELTPMAVKQLEHLAPFGRGNPEPNVLVRGVRLAEHARPMGAHGAHMQVRIGSVGREIRLVGWRWGEHVESLRAGMEIDVVVRPKLNTWKGIERVEGEVRDLRESDGATHRRSDAGVVEAGRR